MSIVAFSSFIMRVNLSIAAIAISFCFFFSFYCLFTIMVLFIFLLYYFFSLYIFYGNGGF